MNSQPYLCDHVITFMRRNLVILVGVSGSWRGRDMEEFPLDLKMG